MAWSTCSQQWVTEYNLRLETGGRHHPAPPPHTPHSPPFNTPNMLTHTWLVLFWLCEHAQHHPPPLPPPPPKTRSLSYPPHTRTHYPPLPKKNLHPVSTHLADICWLCEDAQHHPQPLPLEQKTRSPPPTHTLPSPPPKKLASTPCQHTYLADVCWLCVDAQHHLAPACSREGVLLHHQVTSNQRKQVAGLRVRVLQEFLWRVASQQQGAGVSQVSQVSQQPPAHNHPPHTHTLARPPGPPPHRIFRDSNSPPPRRRPNNCVNNTKPWAPPHLPDRVVPPSLCLPCLLEVAV